MLLYYTIIHAIIVRAPFIKLLLILEFLFLIILFGFITTKSILFATASNLAMALCLIAIAACEAVLGLALLILRTRIFTTSFIFTHTFVYYLKTVKHWLTLKN